MIGILEATKIKENGIAQRRCSCCRRISSLCRRLSFSCRPQLRTLIPTPSIIAPNASPPLDRLRRRPPLTLQRVFAPYFLQEGWLRLVSLRGRTHLWNTPLTKCSHCYVQAPNFGANFCSNAHISEKHIHQLSVYVYIYINSGLIARINEETPFAKNNKKKCNWRIHRRQFRCFFFLGTFNYRFTSQGRAQSSGLVAFQMVYSQR